MQNTLEAIRESNPTRATTPRRSSRSGHALVEAAMVLPIVIVFIMGLFEYGRYFLMLHVYGNAVASGAAYACKHTSPIVINGTTYGSGVSDVTNVVNSGLGSLQLSNATVSAYLSDGLGNALADSAGNNPGLFTSAGIGQYVTVQLSGTYSFMPTKFLFLPSSTTITIKATRRSEAN
jgi:Flp pilus assembly protein TadG